jgi:hypothetical protein
LLPSTKRKPIKTWKLYHLIVMEHLWIGKRV